MQRMLDDECYVRFMTDLLNFPELIRNIVIVGHLHHGKTSFVDMLVSETHDVPINVDQPVMTHQKFMTQLDFQLMENHVGALHGHAYA